MWFKNIFVYRLPKRWNAAKEDIDLSLKSYAHQAPSALEMKTMGFVPPFFEDEESPFLFALDSFWLAKLTIESRILPASVVNQTLMEKLQSIQKEKGFLPNRKERLDLKESILEELMPRAFLTSKQMLAWMDVQNGFLLVNAASPNAADSMIEMLNDAIVRFPLKNLHTEKSPQTVMTQALLNPENLKDFSLAKHCVLESCDENKESVRYNNHFLQGGKIQEEIKAHIQSGKVPKALGLYYKERFSFVLTDKMQIKNIRLEEDLFKERDDSLSHTEDEKSRFVADFLLMSAEFSQFLPDLIQFLGGEKNVASL